MLHLEGVLYPLSRVPHTLTVETPFGSAGVERTEVVLREGEGETSPKGNKTRHYPRKALSPS